MDGKNTRTDVNNKSEMKNNDILPEDEGEDLPDNFFDDFSNKDFMDGINIVDDWIDEEEAEKDRLKTSKNDKHGSRKLSERDGRRSPNRDRRRYEDRNRRYRSRSPRYRPSPKKRSRSPRKRSRSPRKRSRSPRKRSRTPRKRSRSLKKTKSPRKESTRKRRSRSKQEEKAKEDADKLEVDRRRDPEKTKRDIQRDKIRCAKDHEARVFQEQLKVAETGLVPPGMELDIVLQSELFKYPETAVEDDEKPKEQPRKESSVEKRRNHQAKPQVRRSRSRNESYGRKYTRSRSRRRFSKSPIRRRRSRSRSLDRERRFREKSADIDLRYRLWEKREKYKSNLSPLSDEKIVRSPLFLDVSPESVISERESWLRSSNRRTKSHRSRSCSPISINSLTDRTSSPRRRKKCSFMEELEIKLQQTTKPCSLVPKPPIITPDIPEFFIGGAMNFTPNPPMYMAPGLNMLPNMVPGPSVVSPPESFQFQPVPHPGTGIVEYPFNRPLMPFHGPGSNANVHPTFPDVPHQVPTPPIITKDVASHFRSHSLLQKPEQNNELTKLFEDKKISLSDFLSVSAKSLDGSPITPEITGRIKIISRCQDALRSLDDPKFMGKFFPKIHLNFNSEQDLKTNQSPLRNANVVRFNFTTPVNKRRRPRQRHNHTSFTYPSAKIYLHKLLATLGITDVVKKKVVATVPTVPVVKTTIPVVAAPFVEKDSIGTQTEAVKCQSCEIRRAKKYEDSHTQTVEPTSYDVSTQVNMEDLNKSTTTFTPRGISTNINSAVQSIAHLTPAQILGLNTKKDDDSKWMNAAKKEMFSSSVPTSTTRSYSSFSPDKPRGMDDTFPRSSFNDNYSNTFNRTDNNRSNVGANRFDSNPNRFDSSLGRFEPNRFDSGANRFDSATRGGQFDNPFDPRRFFEPNKGTGSRFIGNSALNTSNFFNRGNN